MSAAQAVEKLISEYGKLVFHTIYGLTGDWEESQDLTQETFAQALKAIDAARAKSGAQFHAKAWLLRIALNTVRMQRRRQSLFRFIPFSRMQKRESEEKAGEVGSDILSESASSVQPVGYGASYAESGDPETLVVERDAVQRVMARLSEPLRICLLLSVVGSFSTIEIAEMLDLEEAAVRQRLARARKQFQRLYALESSEDLVDNTQVDESAMGTANRHGRDAGKGSIDKHRNSIDHASRSNERRRNNTHAERFHRDSAASPLW
jgi:RNA polymerase sigma-70 factor (ECF subfamily)